MCAHVMHGRSRMTIRPSHLYNAGTEHVGVSSTGQALLAPSAKRNVRCPASRLEGELHPLLVIAREAAFSAFRVLSCKIAMTTSS